MQKEERRIAVMNPYDAIGKVHNKGLDFVIEKLNPQEEIKYERIVELVSQYIVSLKTNEPHKEDCTDMKEDFIFGYVGIGKSLNLIATKSISEIMLEHKFNEKQKCFMDAILNVSEDRDLDREGTLKILLNIEEQMFNADLTPQELEIPFMCSSIAKYSVKYFMEQISNDNSEWKNFISGDLAKFKWPWKEDALGALGGLSGGLLGAIGGAIAGSLGAALTSNN